MTSWISTPLTVDIIRGAIDLESTARGVLPHRLPAWARAQYPDPQLGMSEAQPSGVRLSFRTTATAIELDTIPTKRVYVGMPPRPDGVYDLLIDGQLVGRAEASGGDTVVIDMSTGSLRAEVGPVATVRFTDLPDGAKDVELWLPHNEQTELVALRTDAPIEPRRDTGRRVWLHHGSSISQGSNAATPSAIWPAVAAVRAGVDLVNLGFGGNALLDPFTARTMRDTPADLISVTIGINLVNTDLMRARAFTPAVHGFLDTIRDGHPTTPLLVVSPILCPIHEETPGPSAFDLDELSRGNLRFLATGNPAEVAAGKLTLQVIRTELARIVKQRAAGDPHLDHLDGLELYGAADADELPLPDALHPDTATHQLIGNRFHHYVFGPQGAFASR